MRDSAMRRLSPLLTMFVLATVTACAETAIPRPTPTPRVRIKSGPAELSIGVPYTEEAPHAPTPVPPTTAPQRAGFGVQTLSNEPPGVTLPLGTEWVRSRVFWSAVTSPIDWSWSDAVVDRYEAAGVKLILAFWINQAGSWDRDCSTAPMGAYSAHVAAMVARYAGRVAAYNPDNEMDLCAQRPETYAQRLISVWTSARLLDPAAQVWAGPVAMDRPSDDGYLLSWLAAMDAQNCPFCFDLVATNYYDSSRQNWAPRGIAGKYSYIRGLLQGAGHPSPSIAVTEQGIAAAPAYDGWTRMSESNQVAGTRRLLAECYATRAYACITYRLADDSGGGYQYGLIRADGTARPALAEWIADVEILRGGGSYSFDNGPDRIGRYP